MSNVTILSYLCELHNTQNWSWRLLEHFILKEPRNALGFTNLISTHCNCIGIVVITILKMATWMVETCRWLLRNVITFLNPSALVGSFTRFVHLINTRNMEHIKLITGQKRFQRYSTSTKLTEHKVRYLYAYIWKYRWGGINFISSSCSRC